MRLLPRVGVRVGVKVRVRVRVRVGHAATSEACNQLRASVRVSYPYP